MKEWAKAERSSSRMGERGGGENIIDNENPEQAENV
jgi:hypothetical protein